MLRLKSLIDQKQARLRLPNLPHDEIFNLTSEVIKLTSELRGFKALGMSPAGLAPC
jgi:hypothetical protein